jgi:hypothetical protein
MNRTKWRALSGLDLISSLNWARNFGSRISKLWEGLCDYLNSIKRNPAPRVLGTYPIPLRRSTLAALLVIAGFIAINMREPRIVAERAPAGHSDNLWVESGLVRVGKTTAPGSASSIDLFAARGETVDTQVVVRAPAGGLTNVNLSASALTGPGSATIPASIITIYREYYVTVTGTANYGGGSNPPLGSGIYPEPLIPFNDPETGAPLCGTAAVLKACNASISAGQNQPYWIDISVPRVAKNSPPGIYTGSISITATQGTATIPVSLTVWNFELPLQPTEFSIWSLWPPHRATRQPRWRGP